MSGQRSFAYSFDRDLFTGTFATRDAALAAAFDRVKWLPAPITTVYTACLTSGDALASCHAKDVVDRMRRTARERLGDDAQGYVERVTNQQLHELDVSLETVIRSWLMRHALGPKFHKTEDVCEHAVPLVQTTPDHDMLSREVGAMGEGADWERDERLG